MSGKNRNSESCAKIGRSNFLCQSQLYLLRLPYFLFFFKGNYFGEILNERFLKRSVLKNIWLALFDHTAFKNKGEAQVKKLKGTSTAKWRYVCIHNQFDGLPITGCALCEVNAKVDFLEGVHQGPYYISTTVFWFSWRIFPEMINKERAVTSTTTQPVDQYASHIASKGLQQELLLIFESSMIFTNLIPTLANVVHFKCKALKKRVQSKRKQESCVFLSKLCVLLKYILWMKNVVPIIVYKDD